MKRNRRIVLAAAAMALLAVFAVACIKRSIVITAAPRFAYVSNESDNTISGYELDSGSGVLSPVAGTPFAGPTTPRDGVVCISGQFLYVSNGATNGVSAYKINAATGTLTPVPGSPFAGGAGPRGIAVVPSGQFVYTANRTDNDVTGYVINNATGGLTQVPGSPFTIPPQGESQPGPQQLTVDPTGRFLYVSNHLTGSISGFTINATTGALTQIAGSPFSDQEGAESGTQPFAIVVTPSGKFVYVTNHGSSTLSIFSADTGTGALTPLDGSPFFIEVDDEECNARPYGLAISPTGQFLYVADNGCDTITVYSIDATSGVLTEISGSPFQIDVGGQDCAAGPNDGSLDPSGRYFYVANNSCSSVAAFSVDAITGALTPVAGTPFPAGNGPYGVAIARLQLQQ